MISKSDPNRMTTRSVARLSPNGKSNDIVDELEIDANELKTDIKIAIGNARKIEIPKLKEELKNGENSVEYFRVEMYKINDKVKDLYKSMNNMKELIKKEAKKSKERAIQHSINNR